LKELQAKAKITQTMTRDGLVVENQNDRYLERYDTIIVDEAHERSLNVDFLLGVLRRIRIRRPDLRIVIASATIDTEAFAKAFADAHGHPAPVVQVEGRSYPVGILYRDELVDQDDDETLPERTASAIREMLEIGEGKDAQLTDGTSGYIVCFRGRTYKWEEGRDYLWPIPTDQRVATGGALSQNPGYEDGLSF
jgi:HrpA-like RNA helicase